MYYYTQIHNLWGFQNLRHTYNSPNKINLRARRWWGINTYSTVSFTGLISWLPVRWMFGSSLSVIYFLYCPFLTTTLQHFWVFTLFISLLRYSKVFLIILLQRFQTAWAVMTRHRSGCARISLLSWKPPGQIRWPHSISSIWMLCNLHTSHPKWLIFTRFRFIFWGTWHPSLAFGLIIWQQVANFSF